MLNTYRLLSFHIVNNYNSGITSILLILSARLAMSEKFMLNRRKCEQKKRRTVPKTKIGKYNVHKFKWFSFFCTVNRLGCSLPNQIRGTFHDPHRSYGDEEMRGGAGV